MSNVLIFQPYLSNRMLSSNTVERQFRFLKKQENCKVYALLDESEQEYADYLKTTGWVEPIVRKLHDAPMTTIIDIQKEHKFNTIFIARTYFTPCTEEHIRLLKERSFPQDDFRYWRNYIPIAFADLGVSVHHVVYDPLELKYDEIIAPALYSKCSSMNNVEGAIAHSFADVGYYDKGKELTWMEKDRKFTFGATSVEPERTKLLLDLNRRINSIDGCTMYLRAEDINTLVPNDLYEENVSKSMFTYTVPSYDPKHMSFTRMLLALSQGTIPLLHPDNNLDCLFGDGFDFRKDLRAFFEKLVMSHEQLEEFLKRDYDAIQEDFIELMNEWQHTDYYKWLQENS